MTTMTVVYEADNGQEVSLKLPAKMDVCWDCEGYGTVMNESMRSYGYSSEEFYESFDEEERHEYFRRGGIYDVQCPTCKGKNVVPVIDEDKIPEADKAAYAEWCKYDEYRAQCEAEDRATYRMESGYRE